MVFRRMRQECVTKGVTTATAERHMGPWATPSSPTIPRSSFPPHPPTIYPSTPLPTHYTFIYPPSHPSLPPRGHRRFSQGQAEYLKFNKSSQLLLLLLMPLGHEGSVSGLSGRQGGCCSEVEENREDLSCAIRTRGTLGRMGTRLTLGLRVPADHTQARTCAGRGASRFKGLC